ncbi:DUF1993 domain-containing protein [Sphingomonas sp. M1-B02]|uniref:DUF1993 domain-containing protein n=1 Tax=Sphingomonas sp. M1-B02 TaxID=3114300 RepID=UPI00223EFBA5|nr:DUF1993 domain-containing protein [Sphingomonas sp. S6-11]UZK67442.1 DUF1993 domain-containing protein [Sphingomonas sp. S6-11]
MATELHALSVPAFLRGFKAMSAILEKGRAFADEQGIPHAELLGARLYEDMAPLTSQIQRASDSAKFAGARLAGIDAPSMPDTEDGFEALQNRIAKTVSFLESIAPGAIDGREDAEVQLKTPSRSFEFSGRNYLLGFALPNFYFHLTTAYAILRHKGVPLGKMDYLGGMG